MGTGKDAFFIQEGAMAESKRYLSPLEAKQLVGCSLSKLYQLAAEGAIPHYRIGRKYNFLEADIRAYLEKCRVAASVEPPKQQLKHLQL